MTICARFEVKRGGGLVGQNDPRPIGERPGDGDALRLASRKLCRECVFAAPDLEIVEEVDSPLSRIGWLVARELQHECDVVDGIQKWKQVVELENEPDLLQPQPAKIVSEPFAIEDDLAIQAHASARGIEDAGDDVEQRRLARAGGPAQGHHLAGRDVDRDVAQGIDAGLALAKMLGDASQAHQCVF